ncbi:MAG: type II toxin-antitoxin system prevent-host-death family antitoxin [Nocardioidaceae bacterium]
MTTIPQRELRNDNGPIIDRVIAGESFVVTRRGKPVADLVPHVDSHEAGGFVTAEEIRAGLGGLPPIDAPAWLADARAIDDLVEDGDRDPWASA